MSGEKHLIDPDLEGDSTVGDRVESVLTQAPPNIDPVIDCQIDQQSTDMVGGSDELNFSDVPPDGSVTPNELYSTPVLGLTPLAKRKPGRPTNAAHLLNRVTGRSEGNIKDMFKRKREELALGVSPNPGTSSPFKKSSLTLRSPEKSPQIPRDSLNAVSNSALEAQNSANRPGGDSPETQSVGVEDVKEPDFMKTILEQFSMMRRENLENIERLESKLNEANAASNRQLMRVKEEIQLEIKRTSAHYEGAIKELERKFNDRLSGVESKLEDTNPRLEIAALKERVARLEENNAAIADTAPTTDMSKLQRRLEDQEKALITNNMVIKGLDHGELPPLEAVKSFLQETFGIVNAVFVVREIGKEFNNHKILIVKLNSRATKKL